MGETQEQQKKNRFYIIFGDFEHCEAFKLVLLPFLLIFLPKERKARKEDTKQKENAQSQ